MARSSIASSVLRYEAYRAVRRRPMMMLVIFALVGLTVWLLRSTARLAMWTISAIAR